MAWNLQEVAVKPFPNCYKEMLMVLEASGSCCESSIDGSESPRGCCAAICTLLKKKKMVLETAGGCCESIIDGLESLGGCCEAIYILLQINIYGFESFRRLL